MYHWIVLAGSRPRGDVAARFADVRYKALMPVAGVPMLRRVVDALRASGRARRITILMQEPHVLAADITWEKLLADPDIEVAASRDGICDSLIAATGDGADWPVMVTTADSALLTGPVAADFADKAAQGDGDMAIAFISEGDLRAAFPDSRRTIWRFRDGGWKSFNLFALKSPRCHKLLAFWQRAEKDRKRVLHAAARAGPAVWLLMLLRLITLAEACARVGRRFGADVDVVVMRDAAACIDVDSREDLELVEQVLRAR